MIVDGWSSNRAVQTLFIGNQTQAIFQRSWDGTNWTSWTRMDNFGYDTLSDLASALGVPSRIDVENLESGSTYTFAIKRYTLISIYETTSGANALITKNYSTLNFVNKSANFDTIVTVSCEPSEFSITNLKNSNTTFRIVNYYG